MGHHLNNLCKQRFHIANGTGAGRSEESLCECGAVDVLK